MELSKKDSKMLQGLSVLAMVWLHLFNREAGDLFTPMLFIGPKPLSFLIAQLADFCVFGFAFVSGYGHMAQTGEKGWYRSRLKGLLSVLISYWSVLAVFTVVSVIAGNAASMPGDVWTFLKHVLTTDSSYNGAWWYMFAYAVIVLASPLILKAVEKWHPLLLIPAGGALYIAAYAVRFWIPNGGNWVLTRFGPLGMTAAEYVIGAFFFKYRIFSKTYAVWEKINRYLRAVIGAALIAVLLICRTYVVPALFFAPVSGIALITLFHFWKKPNWIEKAFAFVGSHSTNVWLTHLFFCQFLFKNLVYLAKYPLLIYLFLIGITLGISMILQFIEAPLQKLIKRKGTYEKNPHLLPRA